ncbi:MAG: efflux RND transporter periplasmic adaptor subunit [Candidatus Binatia bacterium]
MGAAGRRLLLWGTVGSVLLAGLVYAFWPKPVPVDLAAVSRGALVVTVGDEGETRVRDIFALSAPVAGRVMRIQADVGDPVTANETVLVEIEPIDPDFLDPRRRAEAEAGAQAAESAQALAEAELAEATAELQFADTELERARELRRANTVSQRELDEAERLAKTRHAAHDRAAANLQMRTHDLARARAQLVSPVETQERAAGGERVALRAPVTGRVLRVPNDSSRVVAAGEALVEIGDPRDLEIVVDLLSADAVKVAAGQRVMVEGWGGEAPLEGRVRRVEPFGFTKISALGIEEQRVNVIIDLTSPPEAWSSLGHGYQVDVRIVLWEGADVLKLPLTALFRDGDGWAVFADVDGVARERGVQVGRRTGLEAQIVEGLADGDLVVVHPGQRVVEGASIAPRE